MSTITAPLSPSGIGHAPIVGRNHRTAGPRAGVDLGRALSWALVALLLVAGLLLSWLVGSSVADEPAPAPVTVVVQSGDTVWELAREHAPAGMSVQDYAMVVVTHNGVSATALRPGSVLELPQ